MSKPHVKARQEKPDDYKDRYPVPDDIVGWEVSYDEYAPEEYTNAGILKNPAADPADIKQVKHPFESYTGKVKLDAKGYPLNPAGRTGLAGRGRLYHWGANLAADAIITRHNSKGELEMIAILRQRDKIWAIPGGMVDEGEDTRHTAHRELGEETHVYLSMKDAVLVYKGYVDDKRNTDNAWMETTAYHLHVEDEEVAFRLVPVPGDDAADAQWKELTDEFINSLYASHGDIVRRMLEGGN